MSKNIKIFVVLLSLISIVLLCTTLSFYILKENEKEKKMVLQKNLDEIVSLKQSLEGRLKELEIMNAELKTNIKSQEEKINMLSKAIEEEKALSTQSLAKIQARESEIEKLKSKLEEEKIEKEDLLKRLEKISEDYLNIKFQLEILIKTKEELEKKAKELAEKEGVSLGTIVIKQPTQVKD